MRGKEWNEYSMSKRATFAALRENSSFVTFVPSW
jgi:hypothetical protein